MRRVVRIAAVYLLISAVVAVSLGFIGPLRKLHSLSKEGVRVFGVVEAPDCRNHNSFKYSFQADGVTFKGQGLSREGVQIDCSLLKVGSAVEIFYLPTDPRVSISGDPHSKLANEFASIALAALLLPAFLVGAFILRGRLQNA